MDELLLAFLWTSLISALTTFIDFIIGIIIIYGKSFDKIYKIILKPIVDNPSKSLEEYDKKELARIISEILKEGPNVKAKKAVAVAWGMNLATLAIALDFTAYGACLTNPGAFPFFTRWTIDDGAVWNLFILINLTLLTISIIFKYAHSEKIGSIPEHQMIQIFERNIKNFKNWIDQNSFMILSCVIGFSMLFCSVAILMNAV